MFEEASRQSENSNNYWLIVERIENWRVDHHSEFKFFGIPRSLEKTAAKIRRGDILVVYVSSGISAFSDVRRVTSDKLEKLRFGGDYDTGFPICIKTESVFELERKSWVPIKEMLENLSATKGHKDWRAVMRRSLRKLETVDAEFIISRMKTATSAD